VPQNLLCPNELRLYVHVNTPSIARNAFPDAGFAFWIAAPYAQGGDSVRFDGRCIDLGPQVRGAQGPAEED
jgi:hypothetical protein